ncbi:MAG: Hsp20/alpha crystallin family protein [Anaerolineaceae bacterium]|nr:Hsp20/alpha crystallin family protein [Anaerolineaceae bacterium]
MSDEMKSIEVKTDQNEMEEKTERIRDRRVYMPRTDIYESADELVLVMDMPGVSESDVDIVLEKNVLTIKGFPVFDRPEKLNLAYAEYGEGDYQRSFALSDEVDRGKIEARVKNGVLYLHLGKAEQKKPQKIAVKAG